jgi:hypothetical protein
VWHGGYLPVKIGFSAIAAAYCHGYILAEEGFKIKKIQRQKCLHFYQTA